jgi:hypothetical protein
MRETFGAMVMLFAVGCGGIQVDGSGSALDTNPQPPTPNPPWCGNCPEAGALGRAVRTLDPLIQTRVHDALRTDPSLPIQCEQIWPNQLEDLVRARALVAELWQVAPPELKDHYNQEIIRIDQQMSILERYLSTCP